MRIVDVSKDSLVIEIDTTLEEEILKEWLKKKILVIEKITKSGMGDGKEIIKSFTLSIKKEHK